MTIPIAKEARVQQMIAEFKDIEKYIENEIRMAQIRLDEQRKRRAILEEYIKLIGTNND